MRYELNRFHSRKNPKRYSFEGQLKTISFGKMRQTSFGKMWQTFAKFMLLKDVAIHTPKGDVMLTDHMWIDLPSTFVPGSDLVTGTHVGFTGIVVKYKHTTGETDFSISDVENFTIIRNDIPWNLLTGEAA